MRKMTKTEALIMVGQLQEELGRAYNQQEDDRRIIEELTCIVTELRSAYLDYALPELAALRSELAALKEDQLDASFWQRLAIEYASDIEAQEYRYSESIAAQAAEDERYEAALFAERQANNVLRSQIATMQAELSALQPAIDPDVDADVRAQFEALWESLGYNERPIAFGANRYRYDAPSSIYPARVGRRRVFRRTYTRLQKHRWMGGVAHCELMALAKYEGLYATHRKLAALRAYAADWNAMAEQMLNDSIPW